MKKKYEAPSVIVAKLTYEVVYARGCHFADYKECSPSDQQFK